TEAVGVVTVVETGLTGRKVGDVVAYAEEGFCLIKSISNRTNFFVESGHTVLVHATAGGVGSFCASGQMHLGGATVIGTVSTKEKADQAKEDRCHHVILYKEEDFVTRVNEITSGITGMLEAPWINGEFRAVVWQSRPNPTGGSGGQIPVLDKAHLNAIHSDSGRTSADSIRGIHQCGLMWK
ncbi:GroES-like zinc-binding alcohol dehydrogenase family protein, partial [Striga hermonthica]